MYTFYHRHTDIYVRTNISSSSLSSLLRVFLVLIGHFEVKGCPLGRESSQECFDAYPLEFVEDLLYGMPKDPAYPGRAYLHGTESRLSMQFKLPVGLVGEQVLLQVRA